MAIGWWTVLQSVPWSDVVSNAPKVAAGAKKLWNAVGKKPASNANAVADAQTILSPEAQSISALQSRIRALEAAAADLQGEMLASSELIKALAEQNTQLIIRIETMRIRLWRLAGALALVGLIVVATAVFTSIR
jgi:hypothetical protein